MGGQVGSHLLALCFTRSCDVESRPDTGGIARAHGAKSLIPLLEGRIRMLDKSVNGVYPRTNRSCDGRE
ncbi:MAG: hypothetical protein LZF62_190008 [Nitrospira sp.]|nr:MAG: hypothetical protein LZF62_190008 [Nitrospira sp.]